MSFRPLKSFLPTADEVLRLDLPKLGEILLVHVNSYEGQVKQRGLFNRGYLLAMLENRNVGLGPIPPGPEYGDRQPEVTRAVMEAFNWLDREGLLIRDPQLPADLVFDFSPGGGVAQALRTLRARGKTGTGPGDKRSHE
jgi:hypothetical protein